MLAAHVYTSPNPLSIVSAKSLTGISLALRSSISFGRPSFTGTLRSECDLERHTMPLPLACPRLLPVLPVRVPSPLSSLFLLPTNVDKMRQIWSPDHRRPAWRSEVHHPGREVYTGRGGLVPCSGNQITGRAPAHCLAAFRIAALSRRLADVVLATEPFLQVVQVVHD